MEPGAQRMNLNLPEFVAEFYKGGARGRGERFG